MYIALYILYALVQAIIMTRYAGSSTAPGLMVFLLAIIAPAVTFVLVFQLIGQLIKVLVTYKT